MSPPSPIPVARPLPNLAATLSAMVAGVVVLSLWLGHFSQVRGSTGAWLALHVERVLLVGDFQAAAGTSMIPNTIYDPLYPAMVAGLCAIWPGGADPVWVGHAVSAASLVLGGCLLVGLWRHIGGWPTALLASLSLAFPPLVSTAGMVRYDLLAVALVLGVAGLGSTAVGRVGLWRWAWVGLLAGLAYDTREFMLAPAGGALVALALLDGWQARRWLRPRKARRRRILVPLVVAGGLLLGMAALPLALGLSPLGGLEALLGYGGRGQFGSGRPMSEVLYVDRFWLPLLLGLGGLGVAAWRGRQRAAAVALLGTLAPYALFLVSSQQSPQYYLLAHVLILSGWAGWLLLLPARGPALGALRLPRGWLRLGVAALLVSLLAPWMLRRAPLLMVSGRANTTPFHSEAWPAWPDEPLELLQWALQQAPAQPLLVVSGTVENMDALAAIHSGRPVAFLFREWTDRLDEALRIYDGEDVLVLSVESPERQHPRWPGDQVLGQMTTPNLGAQLSRVPGERRDPRAEDPCIHGGVIRGACLQREWLAGGQEAVRRRILAEAARRQGLLGSRMLWW